MLGFFADDFDDDWFVDPIQAALALARHTRPTLAAKFLRPCFIGMVVTNPSEPETFVAVRVNHSTSTGL
jgi:hypothetical protein